MQPLSSSNNAFDSLIYCLSVSSFLFLGSKSPSSLPPHSFQSVQRASSVWPLSGQYISIGRTQYKLQACAVGDLHIYRGDVRQQPAANSKKAEAKNSLIVVFIASSSTKYPALSMPGAAALPTAQMASLARAQCRSRFRTDLSARASGRAGHCPARRNSRSGCR